MNEFNLISNILNESKFLSKPMAIGKGLKRIGKNAKKDKIAGALIISPIPASLPIGVAYHIATKKKSRRMLNLIGAKLINRKKAGPRKIARLAKQKAKEFKKNEPLKKLLAKSNAIT
jgi:hypothetical protein